MVRGHVPERPQSLVRHPLQLAPIYRAGMSGFYVAARLIGGGGGGWGGGVGGLLRGVGGGFGGIFMARFRRMGFGSGSARCIADGQPSGSVPVSVNPAGEVMDPLMRRAS